MRLGQKQVSACSFRRPAVVPQHVENLRWRDPSRLHLCADKEVSDMTIAEWKLDPHENKSCHSSSDAAAESSGPAARPLHRIRTTRRQQGISIRSVARRMRVKIEQAKLQEEESSDLSLSTLYKWQKALEVPVANLLVDLDGPLSEPVLKRARMLKLMKTAASILQNTDSEPVTRLAHMLCDQLIEIMPELEDVSPWHTIGDTRTLDELGRVADNPVPERLFFDSNF